MARTRRKKQIEPTSVLEIDCLQERRTVSLDDYIHAVSAYVRAAGALDDNKKKAAQIRLSSALARAIAGELEKRLPQLKGKLAAEERSIAGALRTVRADVSEVHPLDGLRLAIELKPVNLAVGRAIWNRFGDIRAFSVNIHLKFPFCVVGGVLVIPTYELAKLRGAELDKSDEEEEEIIQEDLQPQVREAGRHRSTVHLIQRTIERLRRAGRRRTEADAPHHLESIGIIVYDPDKSEIDAELPPVGSGLRWTEFLDEIAQTYRLRFED